MEKTELHIEYVPVDDLKPYDKNARKHGDFDVDAIAESIRKFGFNDPIGVWGKNNLIVEGHGRLLASKKLGMKKVPIIHLDHLSDEQRRAYALAHNKTAENSEWDMDMLAEELESLNDAGIDLDMSSFGFDKAPEVEKTVDDIEEDEPPEPTDATVSTRGTIWVLGAHRLMCGDSTSKEDADKLFDGKLADSVFTDPPYGVAIGDKNAMLNKKAGEGGRCETNIEGDTMSLDDLYKMLVGAFSNLREHCKPDACYYVTAPQWGRLGEMMMMMMMKDSGLEVRHNLIWEKNVATFSMRRLDYDYQHEPIFYTWTKSHHYYGGGKYKTTIWKFNKPVKSDLHPTMKPVALVANAILDSTKPGDIVADFFGCSGTSIIASEQTGRICYTMEIDPHYVDVIVKRWETLTGKKAVKIA